MDAETLTILVTAIPAVLGAVGTVIFTVIKYKDAKRKEKDAETREFYMFTASNIVREAERMFGDGHGEDKKVYAMTRIQNEANASGIKWIPKLASTSVEQAVALRNDYKNMGIPISEIIKKQTDEDIKEAREQQEEAKLELKEAIQKGTEETVKTTGGILIKKKDKKKDKVEVDTIPVIEVKED